MTRLRISAFVVCLLTFAPVGAVATASAGTLTITSDTTLSEDHYGTVVIGADNVTLDCVGHRIVGDGHGRGVIVDGRTGVTVKTCDVSNFATGFWVSSSSGNTFDRNGSHDNQLPNPKTPAGWITGAGFWIQSSSGNTFSFNRIFDNPSDGLDAFNSSNNLFVGNIVFRNLAGFFLGNHSTANSLHGNDVEFNDFAGFVVADGASDNTLWANLARNNGHGFIVSASNDNALNNNTAFANAGSGFVVGGGAVGNSLESNTAAANGTGFSVVDGANGNSLAANTATANDNGFLILNGSTNNSLLGNLADANALRGFAVAFDANGNSLVNNSASGNGSGCATCGGFVVAFASINQLTGNSANDNLGYGFALISATSNTLAENTGCGNSIFDAFQDGASTGNVWTDNSFCTSDGV